MRMTSTQDLVLYNRSLIAEAQAVRARATEIEIGCLIVAMLWLTSPTFDPSWGYQISRSSPAQRKAHARYRAIADAAFQRGSAHWRKRSAYYVAAAQEARQQQAVATEPPQDIS